MAHSMLDISAPRLSAVHPVLNADWGCVYSLYVPELMIPEDCQLQDLFPCLCAICGFTVIVRGCLDCFPQMSNLHIFMCWYSSATYLLTCSGWAEAQIPHPKFTLQPQPLNWMAQSVIAPVPKQFSLTLWEVVWVVHKSCEAVSSLILFPRGFHIPISVLLLKILLVSGWKLWLWKSWLQEGKPNSSPV